MALSLVKYVLEILVFSLRSLPYLMDKGMDVCHSGLMQFAGWMMIFYGCSMSWTVSTSRCLAGIARSWMASMPTVLVQELRGKELQFRFDGSHSGLHHMVSGIDEQRLDEQPMGENMSNFTDDTVEKEMCQQNVA
jgi:hypothetical protein